MLEWHTSVSIQSSAQSHGVSLLTVSVEPPTSAQPVKMCASALCCHFAGPATNGSQDSTGAIIKLLDMLSHAAAERLSRTCAASSIQESELRSIRSAFGTNLAPEDEPVALLGNEPLESEAESFWYVPCLHSLVWFPHCHV